MRESNQVSEAPVAERANNPPGSRGEASPGLNVALRFMVIPMVLVGVGVMATLASSQVDGTLELRSQAFVPDACVSGSTLGFHGVELTSAADRSTRVRVIEDEAGEASLAILRRGEPARVVAGDACQALKMRVSRTGTVVNDVYLVEGHARVDCEDVAGVVKFERCGS